MKTITSQYFLLGLLLILSSNLLAQCPNSLSISNQEALDNFLEKYPNCTEIPRNITIRGVEEISELSKITKIGGDLRISGIGVNTLDASGLNNLTSIGNNFIITYSKEITELCTNLIEIGGGLSIKHSSFGEISGFNALQKVGTQITITDNLDLILPNFNALEECGSLLVEGKVKVENKFNALKKINGDLKLTSVDTQLDFPALKVVHDFLISKVPALSTINGFNNLVEVKGLFFITSNEELTSIDGFRKLNKVHNTFLVTSNPLLKKITGFTNVQHTALEKPFTISSNNSLEEIDGFDHASFHNKSTGIYDNPTLKVIKGFGGANDCKTELNIDNNPNLLSIDGFNEVQNFQGRISIISAGEPIETNIFQNVETTNARIYISGCNFKPLSFKNLKTTTSLFTLNEVENLPSFENLTEVSGDLIISRLKDVEINSFNRLKNIGGKLSIDNQGRLEVLKGFNKLEEVTFIDIPKKGIRVIDGFNGLKSRFNLYFDSFPDLEVFKGFNALESVKRLTFKGNRKLQTIAGFENLTELEYLEITGNTELVSIPSFNKVIGEAEVNIYDGQLESFNGFNSLEILETKGVFDFFKFKHLAGFDALKKIKSSVLFASERLETIEGFQLLETIEGDIIYGALPKLQSTLLSFENLKLVEDIFVSNKFPFDNISEFPKLERANLIDINGLKTLKGFGSVQYISRLNVTDNATIEKIEGFQQLKSIGSIWIEENASLKEISTFNSLETVGSHFYIYTNEVLEKFNGFEKLVSIGGQLRFASNPMLKEVIGFNALTSVKEIKFFEPNEMEVLSGFNSLEECSRMILHGELIEGFNKLKSVSEVLQFHGITTSEINGFGSLQFVEALSIVSPLLNEFPKFESLTQATNLIIRSLEKIETFSAFENLAQVDRIEVTDSKSLLEIPKFPALTSLNSLSIYGNSQIKSIDRFNKIDSLAKITFIENQKLESIKGFKSLEHIEAILISGNSNLSSLEGLSRIASFPGNDDSTVELVIRVISNKSQKCPIEICSLSFLKTIS